MNNLHLVYSSKEKGTFFSARWQKEYTPDLSIVSRTSLSDNTMATRQVMRDFPHSQHRPVVIKYGLQIPMVRSIPKPRWNFRRANLKQYAKEVDHLLQWIPPVANNYERFMGVIKTVAKKHIPRGFRKTFIPTWKKNCEQLFEDFQSTRDYEIADKMLKILNNNRKQRWHESVEKLDFTRSSHKAWGLMKRLGDKNTRATPQIKAIKPDDIASKLVKAAKVNMDKTFGKEIKVQLRKTKNELSKQSDYGTPFSIQEIETALKKTKTQKAACFDGIYPEFLKFTGAYTRRWLAEFYSDILEKCHLPKQFKRAKVIALLKPGKEGKEATDFRPVSLLSVTYKILERLVLERIQPTIDKVVPIEQAGFRENRSCTE